MKMSRNNSQGTARTQTRRGSGLRANFSGSPQFLQRLPGWPRPVRRPVERDQNVRVGARPLRVGEKRAHPGYPLPPFPPEDRAHPDVLDLRLGIFIAMKRYESAAILAESLISKGSRAPTVFLLGAQAVRESRSIPEAIELLAKGERLLEKNPLFHYTMACLLCQAGDIPATKKRLEETFRLDMGYREKALEDADLEPLWRSLSVAPDDRTP